MTFLIRKTFDDSAYNLYVNGYLALSYVCLDDAQDAKQALIDEPYEGSALYSLGAHIADVIRENVSPTTRAAKRLFGPH